MVKKPEYFLLDVWEKLSDEEKKDVYIMDLLSNEKLPQYLVGAVEEIENIDNKIDILERALDGKSFTDKQKELLHYGNNLD